MSRKIMDCVDVSTGEKIYPVGHAQATYMSDGKTVQEKFDDGDFLDQTTADGLYQPLGVVSYPEVSHTEATAEIAPNTMHVWGEVAALTLTLGAEEEGRVNEYVFQFTSGATATTLTLPSTLTWANGEALTPEANKTYQVSIVNGYAVYAVFPPTEISFSIKGVSYKAAVGMTWGGWVGSAYNTASATIESNNQIMIGNRIILLSDGGNAVKSTDSIIDGWNYVAVL